MTAKKSGYVIHAARRYGYVAQLREKRGYVLYAACRYGYVVQVWENRGMAEPPEPSELVHEYNSGNCLTESTSCVPPDSPDCVPLNKLTKRARTTAAELAEEYGIPKDEVEYDTDLESSLKESLEGES